MHSSLLELQSIITKRIDSATAYLLQHSDMYAVESSEPTNVQVRSSCFCTLPPCPCLPASLPPPFSDWPLPRLASPRWLAGHSKCGSSILTEHILRLP